MRRPALLFLVVEVLFLVALALLFLTAYSAVALGALAAFAIIQIPLGLWLLRKSGKKGD